MQNEPVNLFLLVGELPGEFSDDESAVFSATLAARNGSTRTPESCQMASGGVPGRLPGA